MIISITPQERRWLLDLAHQRSDRKEHLDIYRAQSRAGKPSIERHLFGLLCEYASAKVIGAELDTTIYPDGDGGRPDLYTPTGSGCCVKGRTTRGWDLALQDCSTSGIHQIGILVWKTAQPDVLEIAGYCTDRDFRRFSLIKDYSYGPRRVIEARHLQPIEELQRHLQNARRLHQSPATAF